MIGSRPVWIDMQLPPLLAAWLSERFGRSCQHMVDLGYDRAADETIFAAGKAAGAIIITKDSDFATLVQRQGPPPQIIWLRCGNTSTQALCELMDRVGHQAFALIDDGEPLIEIAGLDP